MIDLQEKVGHITFLTETSAVQFGLIDWTLHIRTRLRTITDAMLRPESQYLSHGSILHEIFSVLCASCHSMEGFQGLKSWWFRDNALSVGTQTKKNGTKTFWERRNVQMGLVCSWIDWTRLKSIETDWNRLKTFEFDDILAGMPCFISRKNKTPHCDSLCMHRDWKRPPSNFSQDSIRRSAQRRNVCRAISSNHVNLFEGMSFPIKSNIHGDHLTHGQRDQEALQSYGNVRHHDKTATMQEFFTQRSRTSQQWIERSVDAASSE